MFHATAHGILLAADIETTRAYKFWLFDHLEKIKYRCEQNGCSKAAMAMFDGVKPTRK